MDETGRGKGESLILDANNLATRAIMACALDDLKSGGQFTGGVYGTLTMLSALLGRIRTPVSQIIAVWDDTPPPERLMLAPYYKQDRKEKRKLLTDEQKERAFSQLVLVRDMFRLLGICCIAYREREADDGVAAAVRVLCKENPAARPVVVSNDADLLQTILWGARVWSKDRFTDADNFEEHTGVPLQGYLVYKTLKGDSSDGLPGLPGCGPVMAAAMVRRAVEAGKTGRDVLWWLLEDMERRVAAKEKLKKAEQALLADRQRLISEMMAVDLSNSFGGENVLALRICDNAARQPVQRWKFLKFCQKLRFTSVLADQHRFVDPFVKINGQVTTKKS